VFSGALDVATLLSLGFLVANGALSMTGMLYGLAQGKEMSRRASPAAPKPYPTVGSRPVFALARTLTARPLGGTGFWSLGAG
jgi:hypothetical protein